MTQITNSHPRDNNIEFIEKGHHYFVKGKKYDTSVTGFVHSFFPKFDADKIIQKMMMSSKWEQSQYYGMEPEEIKEEWRLNGLQASKLGTELHKSIENHYNQNPTPKDTKEYKQFENFAKQHLNLKPFRTEWAIYDEDLKLAGTIDMVFVDNENNFYLYDWKRSKEIKENNQFEEGFYPLSHIPHANYWHYSLQLNIYKYILEKNYGIKIKNLFIVQFHPNLEEYNKLECIELSSEVLDMFKNRYEELDMKSTINSINN